MVLCISFQKYISKGQMVFSDKINNKYAFHLTIQIELFQCSPRHNWVKLHVILIFSDIL